MLNVVGGPDGDANAVLLRAAEPVEPGPGLVPLLHSATGPGNLCKAFGIDLSMNGDDLCDEKSELFIAAAPEGARKPKLWRGPRVGVDYSGIWAKRKLRFCDSGSVHVSRPRPR
jgi:DNA-3-methyladenine glycosylase